MGGWRGGLFGAYTVCQVPSKTLGSCPPGQSPIAAPIPVPLFLLSQRPRRGVDLMPTTAAVAAMERDSPIQANAVAQLMSDQVSMRSSMPDGAWARPVRDLLKQQGALAMCSSSLLGTGGSVRGWGLRARTARLSLVQLSQPTCSSPSQAPPCKPSADPSRRPLWSSTPVFSARQFHGLNPKRGDFLSRRVPDSADLFF